ncbi:MAG: hypothetical protein H6839_11205 [Planctomycetes bacterium]|nr:hypothetical protein [Planctomycetota bacterium]
MSHTKRISRKTHTSVRLKKADTTPAPLNAAPVERPQRRPRSRTQRVLAAREMIGSRDFDLDGAFAQAVTKLIEREIDG